MNYQLYETRKQKLVDYYKRHKQLPTYDELAGIFDLNSKGSLHKYLHRFVEDGFIAKSDTGRLIPTTKLYGLRVLGTVQAGFPTDAEEEDIDTLSLDEYLIKDPKDSYMLQVNGDSMIDAGIMSGDMVIVNRQKKPGIGDIVVAHVDNEWTMKYFMKKGKKIFLRAANKNYPDIHPNDELQIAGTVTSVIRKYA